MKRRSFIQKSASGLGMASIPALFSQMPGQPAQEIFGNKGLEKPYFIQEMPDYVESGTSILKIGMCQVYTEEWAVEDNFERVLAAIDQAAEKGAEIAITPECVIHGYAWDEALGKSEKFKTRLFSIAEELDGPHLNKVKDKAREHRIHIMIGFVEKGTNDRIHNTAALISPEGDYVYTYRKVHCRHFESIWHWGYFTPGDEFYNRKLDFGDRNYNIGAMICFDREIPESTRCLRALGSELLLCPLATDTSDMTVFRNRMDNEMITRIRATSNEMFIVVVNHAGRFNGGSFIVGPRGELFCQLGEEPDVVVYDVPVGAIEAKFHNDPLGWMGWGYRRGEVYSKYL